MKPIGLIVLLTVVTACPLLAKLRCPPEEALNVN